jgi:hypothetical protein
MLNRKEKDVRKHLIEDNFEFSNQDKEDILNSIKSKINLEVEEKPSFKERFNLKVVYALVCSLVICIVGYFGVEYIFNDKLIDPNYVGKDVESLNLEEGEYCLAFAKDLSESKIEILNNKFLLNISLNKINQSYLLSKNNNYKYAINYNNNYYEYEIYLKLAPIEVYKMYNLKYNTAFNETNLNNDNSGLLFGVKENGIDFYTMKNNEKLTLFVELA